MPGLVTRGILAEMAGPFLASLTLTNAVFLLLQMLQLGDVVFGSAFTAGFAARICLYTLPHFLVITLPISAMAAAVLTLGRMADENEIIALEAGGTRPAALYPAPLMLGAAAAVLSFLMLMWGEPWGMRSLYSAVVEVLKGNTSENLQAGVFNDEIPGTVLFFEGKRDGGGTLDKILIHQTDSRGRPVLLSSKSGTVNPLPGRRGIAVRLDRGALHQIGDAPGEYRVVEFASNSVSLDIGKVIDSRTKFFQEAGMMSAGELAGAVDAEPPGSAERRRLSVLLHSRFSMALAPFLLVLLVIPLAAARFSAGRPVNISLALLVLLFYYVSLRTGMSSGETGRLAPWLAVWLPNVLLLAAAAVAPAVRGTAR